MRLALISDVHANWQALDACVAHARREGADAFGFLGDLVGYGADPSDVVACIQAFVGGGAFALRGNHDDLAVAGLPGTTQADATTAWTHARLAPAQREFLAALPLEQRIGATLFVHASADRPADWTYVTDPLRAGLCMQAARAQDPSVTRVFCGHVHHQRLFYQAPRGGWMAFEPAPGVPVPLGAHRRWVATVGSAGQPRDGDARAMYALWDEQPPRLTFHRVDYDHGAAAAAIRAAGLPQALADRLEDGR